MVTKNTKAAVAAEENVKKSASAKTTPAPEKPKKTKKVEEAPAAVEPETETETETGGEDAVGESASVSRVELAEAVRTLLRDKGLAITEKVSLAAVHAIEESIVAAVSQGFNVVLPGFGKYVLTLREGGERRNPATGGTVTVQDRFVVSFKPGAKLKEAAAGLEVA